MTVKRIFVIIFLLTTFMISCTGNSKSVENISLPELQTQLEFEQKFEREEPFVERNFIPFSDENPKERAVSYGCYRNGQTPWSEGPSKEEIFEDLTIISKYWNLIRVYNADDDTEHILEVIKEHNFPIKVMLGVWLENETDKPEKKNANITNVMRCLDLTKKFSDIIAAVNVGNETQVFWSWHHMDTNDLIRYIRVTREHTFLPVTTADDYNFWNKSESKAVADEVDFIVTHAYPLWNGKTLDESIEWLDQTYNNVKRNHPEKQLVLGEIGWATKYNPDKKGPGEQGTLIKGEVSLKAQEKFLSELDNWVGSNKVTTFWFEAFDEPWKGGGENSGTNEIEKNWGVFYENRTPKESFQNFIIKKENPKKQILKEEEKWKRQTCFSLFYSSLR